MNNNHFRIHSHLYFMQFRSWSHCCQMLSWCIFLFVKKHLVIHEYNYGNSKEFYSQSELEQLTLVSDNPHLFNSPFSVGSSITLVRVSWSEGSHWAAAVVDKLANTIHEGVSTRSFLVFVAKPGLLNIGHIKRKVQDIFQSSAEQYSWVLTPSYDIKPPRLHPWMSKV